MKTFFKIILSIFFLIILISFLTIYFSIRLNSPPKNMPEVTFFKVDTGSTAGEIGEELKKQGLIRNSGFFKLYVNINRTASKMKAGLYKIDAGLSMIDIHKILMLGSEELFKIAIPPGSTKLSIARILEEKKIVKAEDFLKKVEEKKAEGFLFPDTYYFPENYSVEKVINLMLENFYNNLKDVFPDYEKLSDDKIYEKLIMASIIEKEYRIAEEAPVMASVFYNRLKKNMNLQSCATVVYVITVELGKKHPEKLYYKDLEIESVYNTYIYKGLPPGPICNPGKIAIDASFNPEKTDYLYFLLENENSGKHSFSVNLKEHNRSYNLYIKGK